MCMGSSPSVPATPEVQAAPQEQDAAAHDYSMRIVFRMDSGFRAEVSF